jgi:deoxyribodipyrimidine photo-lyase
MSPQAAQSAIGQSESPQAAQSAVGQSESPQAAQSAVGKSQSPPVNIVWFRRDLRLQDHAALHAAMENGGAIVPVYLHTPTADGRWRRGAASNAWLDQSLRALATSLRALGSKLVIRAGEKAAPLLDELIAQTRATHVFWHRLYEQSSVQRDQAIKADLRARGLQAHSFAGHMLNEPHTIRTGVGAVYKVFTPYWRNALQQIRVRPPLPAPSVLPACDVAGLDIDQLQLRDSRGWDKAFWQYFSPGEAGAAEALSVFEEGALHHYKDGRDRPDQVGTSRMGPHLHFGEISVMQIAHHLQTQSLPAARQVHADFYLREVGWRDFGHQLLHYFPDTTDAPLNAKFLSFPWAQVDPAKLKAWQRGNTGIPIVDAGMRELYQTGWMHNRVRMIVASFLTKNLRYHWRYGARWFWQTLLDADLANNTQGWQWTAGCGADAAPYFRVFNPVSQGEKFDPNGDYVRRYVPELAKLPAKLIHQPWSAGGVPGYPAPIVDLRASREAALEAFSTLKLAQSAAE